VKSYRRFPSSTPWEIHEHPWGKNVFANQDDYQHLPIYTRGIHHKPQNFRVRIGKEGLSQTPQRGFFYQRHPSHEKNTLVQAYWFSMPVLEI
jgi:hypothetical protein